MTGLFYDKAMSWDKESFREKLEQQHSFPGEYLFKFIVPLVKEGEIRDILPEGHLTKRNSSSNNYVSVTLKTLVASSEEVLEVYENAYQIEGIISL